MKKLLAATALVGIISLAGISLVNAHGRDGYGPGSGQGQGYGYCDGCRNINNQPMNEEDREKAAAFFAETKDTRKQIVVKKSELRALMHQDNPDEKRVAALTGEIFDLKNLMDEKAKQTFGDNPPPVGFRGPRAGHGSFGRGSGDFGRGPGNCGRGPGNF